MFYLFLAEGFEEVEALATLDVLRRAGIEVKTVGIQTNTVTGSHGVSVVCDCTETEVSPVQADGLILPGGMPGTRGLEASETVQAFLTDAYQNNKWICAICAAPMILGHRGFLQGRHAVCFPGFEQELYGAVISDAFVCRDGHFITAKGMGSAIAFGLAITAALQGQEAADSLHATLQCPCA